MSPSVRAGDQLLVWFGHHRRRIRVGRIVVVELPGRPLGLKRVVRVEPAGGVWVEGDNAVASTDSRELGALPAEAVRATVLLRLWPRPGRVAAPPGL